VQGAVESLSVGEIKLSFRRYLVDHSTGFRSWDPKLQLIICNIEVVTRPPIKSTEVKKKKPKKSSSGSSGKGKGKGKGKWKTISNIAKYLSLCVTNVVLKVCIFVSFYFSCSTKHTLILVLPCFTNGVFDFLITCNTIFRMMLMNSKTEFNMVCFCFLILLGLTYYLKILFWTL